MIFVLLVYIPWWISCTSPVDAPMNDLMFLQQLQSYPDNVISISGSKVFKNHLWYITEELVPLAFFSKGLSDTIKGDTAARSQMFTALKRFEKRRGAGYGKPCFPAEISSSTSLKDLIGPDSLGFFRILGIDPSFLATPVENWKGNLQYQQAEKTVKHLRVVNDSAERGVKLGMDYLSAAKLEDRYQDVLQVCKTSIPYRNYEPSIHIKK